MISALPRSAEESGNRWPRLPLVLMLTVGLLLSLLHCACCDLPFANDGPTIIVSIPAPETSPDLPEQRLPPHCGQCLSHITTPRTASAVRPADAIRIAPSLEHVRPLSGLAGLPLFRPPRA